MTCISFLGGAKSVYLREVPGVSLRKGQGPAGIQVESEATGKALPRHTVAAECPDLTLVLHQECDSAQLHC